MTFSSIRRILLAASLATAGAATLALPTVVHAAPVVAPAGGTKAPDPVATLAAEALVDLAASIETGNPSMQAEYDLERDQVAAAIAARVGVAAYVMQDAWRAADVEHQRALLAAMTQLGTPYRRNTSKPGIGFDCSGLTTYAWGQAGFVLQRQSSAQIRAAAARTAETAQAGDLVQYPGHVMMWLGVERTIVHAPYSGRSVEVDVVKSRRNLKWGDPTG